MIGWWSRFDGPSGLILLLCLMVLWNVFKARIDKFLNSKGIKGYGERAGKWS